MEKESHLTGFLESQYFISFEKKKTKKKKKMIHYSHVLLHVYFTATLIKIGPQYVLVDYG